MCTLFGETKTKARAQQLLLLPVTYRAQCGFNGLVQPKLIQVWERTARALSARVCGKTIKQKGGGGGGGSTVWENPQYDNRSSLENQCQHTNLHFGQQEQQVLFVFITNLGSHV